MTPWSPIQISQKSVPMKKKTERESWTVSFHLDFNTKNSGKSVPSVELAGEGSGINFPINEVCNF